MAHISIDDATEIINYGHLAFFVPWGNPDNLDEDSIVATMLPDEYATKYFNNFDEAVDYAGTVNSVVHDFKTLEIVQVIS